MQPFVVDINFWLFSTIEAFNWNKLSCSNARHSAYLVHLSWNQWDQSLLFKEISVWALRNLQAPSALITSLSPPSFVWWWFGWCLHIDFESDICALLWCLDSADWHRWDKILLQPWLESILHQVGTSSNVEAGSALLNPRTSFSIQKRPSNTRYPKSWQPYSRAACSSG